MVRQVVLDTETTGLDPNKGDRIVEIGCLELINHVPTDKSYQTFLFPERSMSAGASEITGITDEMLVGKPLFSAVYEEFLAFIGDDELVIHNAAFDLKFLNSELARVCDVRLLDERVFCTLMYARKKFPGSPASLDALCRRFEIDLGSRSKHGALIDSFLLADVYLALIGGRQHGLALSPEELEDGSNSNGPVQVRHKPRQKSLPSLLTADEEKQHEEFMASDLGEKPLWHSLGLITPPANNN